MTAPFAGPEGYERALRIAVVARANDLRNRVVPADPSRIFVVGSVEPTPEEMDWDEYWREQGRRASFLDRLNDGVIQGEDV